MSSRAARVALLAAIAAAALGLAALIIARLAVELAAAAGQQLAG